MLQKSKSKRIHQLKYLLLVPIVTGMLVYTSCSEDIEEKKPSTISEEIAEFKLALSSKDELTQEEKGELAAFILDIYPKDVAGISGEGIDGGDHRLTYQTNKEYWDEKLHEDANALPFAQLDKVPVFPGCENLSQEDAKACFQSKITAFIVENFKVENLKDSGLTGRQKIAAKFVITQEGKIEIAGIKANHPDLEAEALWTISQLPDMIPGEKDGKKVAVHYAVPIIFEMAE